MTGELSISRRYVPVALRPTREPAETGPVIGAGGGDRLPVLEVLDRVRAALHDPGAAVLVAPPGTGKTTGVPPALLAEPWAHEGRIVMLEPRRLAARAAARRMAEQCGEKVGGTFGHSVRGERRIGPGTRVEVVTEGLLVRRMQSDPTLEGVSAVVLDEFHERSIDTDLALALLLDLRASLRADLRILVMSATLDPAPVAAMLGGAGDPVPVVEATAPMHPVELRYRPGSLHDPLERRIAATISDSVRSDPGDVLVFLPGRPEIRRTRRELERLGLPQEIVVQDLHGSLPPGEQDAAVRPDPAGRRRVVLSTSLAETSITVPGVRVVIDSGRRRSVRVDPSKGTPALVTTAVSHAGAAQRSGRAGRTAPGVGYRLWGIEDERHRPTADPPEILTGDLAPLALQIRSWGVTDPAELSWIDPPPGRSLMAATELLTVLGALDRGQLTPTGRELAAIGFHPRLASVALAGRRTGQQHLAADLVAVLETARSGPVDVVERVRELRSGSAGDELRRAASDWRRSLGVPKEGRGGGVVDEDAVARLVLAGYPDRVALRRSGERADDHGRPVSLFHLRSGGEAAVRGSEPSSRAEWLVVADLDAGPAGRPGRVHLAAAIDRSVVLDALGDSIVHRDEVVWDDERDDVVAVRASALGAITLSERPLREPDPSVVAGALRAALDRRGTRLLGRLGEAATLRARVGCLRAVSTGGDRAVWPDWSDDALSEVLGDWLGTVRSRADLDRLDVRRALESRLGHQQRRQLDELAPTHWTLATGRRVPLRYGQVDGEPGTVLASVRLRDAIGTDDHPTVGAGRLPVTVELLSPAGRPVQRTTDLPGFWRGSYAAVRSELRGRYPKHPWPDHPWEPLPRRSRR
jgi:ATP-dependent helicase HrpB